MGSQVPTTSEEITRRFHSVLSRFCPVKPPMGIMLLRQGRDMDATPDALRVLSILAWICLGMSVQAGFSWAFSISDARLFLLSGVLGLFALLGLLTAHGSK